MRHCATLFYGVGSAVRAPRESSEGDYDRALHGHNPGKTLVLEYFLHNCAGGYLHNFAVSLCGVSSYRLESTLGRGLSPTSRGGFDSRETESTYHNVWVVFLGCQHMVFILVTFRP